MKEQKYGIDRAMSQKNFLGQFHNITDYYKESFLCSRCLGSLKLLKIWALLAGGQGIRGGLL
jgi:hypothetical protein